MKPRFVSCSEAQVTWICSFPATSCVEKLARCRVAEGRRGGFARLAFPHAEFCLPIQIGMRNQRANLAVVRGQVCAQILIEILPERCCSIIGVRSIGPK